MAKTYNILPASRRRHRPRDHRRGRQVLDAVGVKYDTAFAYTEALLGGCAIDATGTALPDETLHVAEASDAVLLAAVGGPKWDTTDPAKPRPEQGLLASARHWACTRTCAPVQFFAALADASTLKPEIVDGVDMMIVRELTGGLYFGRRERFYDEEGCGTHGAAGQRAYDTLEYREYEVERNRAPGVLRPRASASNKVTSVDKANVLETSRMWREIVHRIGEEYPTWNSRTCSWTTRPCSSSAAPSDFDVVVTENMFGDILSDEAAQITGSLGMLASASLGDGTALYEPATAARPTSRGRASRTRSRRSCLVEMMLRYSFNLGEAADDIRRAVTAVPRRGLAQPATSSRSTPPPTRWSVPFRWATSWWRTCRDRRCTRCTVSRRRDGLRETTPPERMLGRGRFAYEARFGSMAGRR